MRITVSLRPMTASMSCTYRRLYSLRNQPFNPVGTSSDFRQRKVSSSCVNRVSKWGKHVQPVALATHVTQSGHAPEHGNLVVVDELPVTMSQALNADVKQYILVLKD